MKDIIAICVARLHSWEQEKQVRSLCESAEAAGLRVMVFNLSTKLDVMTNHGQGELSVFEIIPMEEIMALVILTESIRNEEVCQNLADRAIQQNIPVISIDHRLQGCYNVVLAYDSSFEKIVRHVIEHHGCREINLVAGFSGNEFSEARINIVKRVMKENGLSFSEEYLGYGQFWEGPARKIAEDWVAQWQNGTQRKPDAIICANDIMAITVSNVLQNHGINIPEEVIITGFDGLELGECCTPKLTTARDDTKQIGIHTMEVIKNCMEHPETNIYDVEIPFHVQYRESYGCEKIRWRNLSEEIMHWYGKSGEIRNTSNDLFMMMNILSDHHRVMQMAQKLEEYQWLIGAENMMLCVNYQFYRDTDIEGDKKTRDLIKLIEIRDGKYSIPVEHLDEKKVLSSLNSLLSPTGQILVVPIHWQTEVYGFIAIAQDLKRVDYGAFYEFTLSMDQIFGTIRKQSQLYNLYVRDPLTSLYNRRGFYEEIERRMNKLQDRKKTLFLVSVDMDRLKYINDNFGHGEGDFAICGLGDALEQCVEGTSGICARFGGDEYMVGILEETDKSDFAFYNNFIQILQEKIDHLNATSGKPYQMGASCGKIYQEIRAVEEIELLMKKADEEMYSCKAVHHENMQ